MEKKIDLSKVEDIDEKIIEFLCGLDIIGLHYYKGVVEGLIIKEFQNANADNKSS